MTQENFTPISDPVENQARIDASTRNGRIKMLLLLLVCAAPVIASYFTFYVIKPRGGQTNYGELIMPIRPIPATLQVRDALQGNVGGSLAQAVPNKWLMVSVNAAAQCDKACVEKLFMMRQVRIAQNTERNRLVPVWLVTDDAPIDPRLVEGYADDHAAVRFLRVSPQALKDWLPVEAGQGIEDSIYLVDPLGNLMMRFPKQPDPKKVIKDLTKLLKWNPTGK